VDDEGRQLYLRALDQPQAQPLEGTRGATNPFFSPDGRWLGFWANGEMKKISTAGGPAIPLTKIAEPLGASWGSNDVIVYGDSESNELWRVAASGGTPHRLTQLNRREGEVSHRLPHVLPGSNAVLFTIRQLNTGSFTTSDIGPRAVRQPSAALFHHG